MHVYVYGIGTIQNKNGLDIGNSDNSLKKITLIYHKLALSHESLPSRQSI